MKKTLTFSGTLVVILIFLSGCAPNLIKVVKSGNINNTKVLISKGSDVNARNKDGYTVLAMASWYGHKEIVELLIENGADVNARSKNDVTALMAASLSGQKEIVELLIENGADVNARDSEGFRTALLGASISGQKDITKKLIESGANVNAKLKNGRTVLGYTENKDIIELLEAHGAKR